MDIRDLPREERPREKLSRCGAGDLSDAELLAVILGTGTKEAPVMELASALTNFDGQGLAGLSEALPEELMRISGIGRAKACMLAAAVELGKRIAGRPRNSEYVVRTPEDAAGLVMEDLRYLKKEVFQVLLLNSKGAVIGAEKVAVGNLNSAGASGREVFNLAVRKSAFAMVLIHNHPSGDPSPSAQDIEFTARLVEAGRLIGISVVDHLVIGAGCYYSFKEHDML